MIIKLIFKNIVKNIYIAILVIITLFIVIFSSTFLNFIFNNIKSNLLKEAGANIKNKVIITKNYKNTLSRLLDNNNLEKIYKDIKKDKNIKKSYVFYTTKIPASADIKFLGFDFNTDIFIYWTDKYENTWDIIKLWLSPTIINIYNSQFQNSTFFPKLNLDVLKKINIKLNFGKNSFFKLNNNFSENAKIQYLDNDFPLFWFTIAKNKLDNIEKKLNIHTNKIYKIVVILKDTNYIQTLKNKYKNIKIQWYSDIEQKINNKLKYVKYVFETIKAIMYTILFSFVVVIIVLILNKNRYNIKVLYYNWASFVKQFSLIFWEITIYIILSTILSLTAFEIINKNIPYINKYIEKKWFVNINIEKINYQNIIINSIQLYIIIIFIAFIIFVKSNKITK